jgi:serine/threonine-protein kinase
VDGRADIYATGCLAYWLLTGQFVFTAQTAMGLIMHHARTPPAPPSARTSQPIPPGLDALILSCLAKDPAQRPQTARDLASRLAELDGGEAWTQERARDWWAIYGARPMTSSANTD